MELTKSDLISGKKFITGKWRPSFFVNFFSNDLAHVPISEMKSDDGSDFSSIVFEFRDDNTVSVTNEVDNYTVNGTWEQTGIYEYQWTVEDAGSAEAAEFLKSCTKLSTFDGNLVFSLGFLTFGMSKDK